MQHANVSEPGLWTLVPLSVCRGGAHLTVTVSFVHGDGELDVMGENVELWVAGLEVGVEHVCTVLL